jgi:hypothetical protein
MLKRMRNAVLLVTLGFAAACSHASQRPAQSASATDGKSSGVTFELDRSPPPQLPNPMRVIDSTHGGNFEVCYQTFRPSGNYLTDLQAMTQMCGPTNGMKPVTPVLQGMQGQNEPIARYTFKGETGRCYRFFASSEPSVRDLDMAVLDPDRAVVGHDTNEDAFPILNPDGPICLTRAGAYTVLVSVERGAGRYALQVWGF